MSDRFDVDASELRLIAQLAGIAPSRLAQAFNDPTHLFHHLNRDELERFKDSCDRLAGVQARMLEALDAAILALRGAMN